MASTAAHTTEGDDDCSVAAHPSRKDVRKIHKDLLRRFPRYRPVIIPQHFEYYAIGHDPAQSSLSGIFVVPQDTSERPKRGLRNRMFSCWGREDSGDQLVRLRDLDDTERAQLSFFYGGCGDCRHVYTTLYDLGRQLSEDGEAVRCGTRVHFLLNDSCPSILARSAILLVALHDLAGFDTDVLQARNKEEVKVLFAFLHYVFFSPIVPVYVHELLCSIIRRLLMNRRLNRAFLFIDDNTWECVKEALQGWLNKQDIMRRREELRVEAKNLVGGYAKSEKDALEKKVKPATRIKYTSKMWNKVNRWEFVRPGTLDPNAKRTLMSLVDDNAGKAAILSTCNLIPLNVHGDLVYTAVHNVLPPPECLLHRAPAAVRSLQRMANAGEEVSAAKRNFREGVARQIVKLAERKHDSSSLFEDMVPNVTCFDASQSREFLEYFYAGERPSTSVATAPRWNPLQVMAGMSSSTAIELPHLAKATLFDLSCNLWHKAALAVKGLTADEEGSSSLIFEFSLGDMNAVAKEIAFAKERRKEEDLPTLFLRAFLSNVPDYTGLVYPLIEITPLLTPSPRAFLRCNMLYNAKAWQDYEEWIKYMLVLNDNQELQALYGVEANAQSAKKTFVWLSKRSEEDSLSQEMIGDAFRRMFLAVGFPPTQPSDSNNVNHTESMVVLMELLVFLANRGVSKDVISHAVGNILLDETEITNPRPSRVPSKMLLEKKQVSGRPFLLEFRTLLSFYIPLLSITLAAVPALNIPSTESIVLHTVRWDTPRSDIKKSKRPLGLVILPDRLVHEDLRELALLPKEEQNDVHFFSTFFWSAVDNIAKFYLPEDELVKMVEKQLKVMLFCTDTSKKVIPATKL